MSDAASDAARWRQETYEPAIARHPERRAAFETSSGIELDPVYAPDPVPPSLGWPGEPPFTRGVQPTMYRGRLWTMRQYAGFATAAASNERYRALLAQGTTGLSVAFDLPTQIGYDPDHPLAAGEVGRVGVSIATLEDMETLFAGIPLDRVSVSMTINSTAIVLLALLVAVAKRQGVDPTRLRGTVQNDLFKEFVARGTQRLPVRPSLRLVTDVIEHATRHLPKFNPVSISGYHIREAGSTAVEEVAFTLAHGIGYVEEAMSRGLAVDDFAPRLSFFFNAHNHLFEEVAKFRAARRLWASIMAERFGAKDPSSLMLRFHTQTGGSTLQARQVDVNVVRVTVQALAAVLGGTQSLHTNGRDEALALPSEESAVLALRTQQVLGYESGVTDVVDPLGGSPYVEQLTDEIEARARAWIARIDDAGGTIAAVEAGLPQRAIETSAYEAQRRIESGDDVVVGVNKFASDDEASPELFRIDPALETEACERVQAWRARRDATAWREALASLATVAADEGANVFPAVLVAVEAGATVGEVLQVFEDRYGTFLAPRPVEVGTGSPKRSTI
ncbi:MAG: methylmalonyl-CoA mutase [Planctomycetes bacterium]|nr:methylmalonyl-CoA mutase [Planctomycetota bacterium]MCB9824559.1 methylmalonyl-CoA mutase [Planctomycetota bacterium]MCB9829686.1 methylmalonyl-CoA mutase [Planctomycetota bacterium]MCB9900029.1 methylmalonyl-CoA mutase [Planctomycetota bacterium]